MKYHGGTQRIVAAVEGWDGETVDWEFEVKEGLLKFDLTYPTDDELESLPKVWLTNGERPWDPTVLDDDTVTIPSCYNTNKQVSFAKEPIPIPETSLKLILVSDDDGLSSFQELQEIDLFSKRLQKQNFVVQALWMATGFTAMKNIAFSVMNLVGSKTQVPKTKFKEPDYEKYRPRLGWFPMEVIKKTFENTTQLYMKLPSFHPFRKHFKSRAPQLNRPRLAETYSTDTGFSSEPALGGITCFQLFVGNTSLRTAIYGIQTEDQ